MSGPPIAQDANRLVVFGSQLIGVVIVIVGMLTQQGELRSVRPPGRANMPALSKTDAKTDTFARLWDDPLQVRQPAEEAPSGDSTPSPSPTPTPQQASYIFLWNILDGAPWPDAKERRLRIRYTVVSAILAEGYRPLSASRLHSLQMQTQVGRIEVGRFETFRKQCENNTYEYVCVIWMPKQSTKFPIDQQELKTEIRDQDKVIADGPFWFLHHGTSQDLHNYLYNSQSTLPAATEASPPQSVSFMRATIPLTDLTSGASSPPANRPFVQEVTTDDKLVDSLFQELCLRIPALNDPCKAPRVVVFTESDSIYSKAIVDKLKKQLSQHTNAKCDVYSYLQALDGSPEEARAQASPSDSKPPDIATSLLQGRAISETSFGTSQFDYLRRAALDLKAQTESAGGERGRGWSFGQ